MLHVHPTIQQLRSQVENVGIYTLGYLPTVIYSSFGYTHTHTYISQKLPPSFSDSTLPPARIFMIFNKSGAWLIRLLTHAPEAPWHCDG